MRVVALAVIAAAGLALTLSACQGSHGTPPASAASPAAGTPAALFDREPACTNALESEFDQAARDGRTGSITIGVPPACKGLSPAQAQALADEIAGNYAQAQAFANAFRQALAQIEPGDVAS